MVLYSDVSASGVGNGSAQVADHFALLFFLNRPRSRDGQFGVCDCGVRLTVADRHSQFDPQRPFLLFPRIQVADR